MTAASALRLHRARARLRAHPRWRWLALLVAGSGMMLSVINVSIVNIALPEMAADLGADVSAVGWVVTGFLVTQATLLPLAGRAGDLYGRRRVFVIGLVTLCVGSALCALAWSLPSLIAFRMIQGIGACVMAPTAFATAAELFPLRERGAAMGMIGGVIGLAPVLALTVAGMLVAVAGWRSVFWFTPVLGVGVLAGAALVMQESERRRDRHGFDLPGAALAAAGLLALLLALSRGEVWGWTSAPTLGAAALAPIALAAFVARERRARSPMIDLALFRQRSLATANLAGGASAAALFGVLLTLPFFLTAALGAGPVELGLEMSTIAAAFVLVSPLAGRAMARVGSVRLATTGFLLAALGCLGMAWATPALSFAALLPGLAVFGCGLAMTSAPLVTTAMRDVPLARLGVASALPNTSRYTGGAVGAAVLGAILHAALPAGAPTAAAAADGMRMALLAAAGFALLAGAVAARMPEVGARALPPPPPRGALLAPAAGPGAGE
jgi:EmrB/QacA subfamily drug resistance transporter